MQIISKITIIFFVYRLFLHWKLMLTLAPQVDLITLKKGFFKLRTTDNMIWTILCCGGLSGTQYRSFSSIPGFYSLDASSAALIVIIKKCLQILSNVPSRAKSPPGETHWSKNTLNILANNWLRNVQSDTWGFWEESGKSFSTSKRAWQGEIISFLSPNIVMPRYNAWNGCTHLSTNPR